MTRYLIAVTGALTAYGLCGEDHEQYTVQAKESAKLMRSRGHEMPSYRSHVTHLFGMAQLSCLFQHDERLSDHVSVPVQQEA